MFLDSSFPDCRLLVVIEKQKHINDLLINTVNFRKLINAEVNILFVVDPKNINSVENPLVFINNIEDEISKINTKLKKITEIICDQENISIDCKVDVGKLETVVNSYVNEINPHVILINNNLGNNKLWNNRVIPDYLKDFKGSIIITNEKNITIPRNKLKLGCFGPEVFSKDNKVIQKLLKSNSYPIYVYLSITNVFKEKIRQIKNIIETEFKVFEFQTENKDLGILKYLNYCKVDLLCIDNPDTEEGHLHYKEIIDNSKIPLLVIKS